MLNIGNSCVSTLPIHNDDTLQANNSRRKQYIHEKENPVAGTGLIKDFPGHKLLAFLIKVRFFFLFEAFIDLIVSHHHSIF